MLLVFGTTLITADIVNSLYINNKKEDVVGPSPKIWYKPSTWKLKPEVTTRFTHVLTITYCTPPNGLVHTFTMESADLPYIQNHAKEILKQIKMQTDIANQEMVDKLFEEAVKEA